MAKLDLADQVIIITGAGGGLGKAYAHYFAEKGAKVLVNNRVRPDAPAGATSAERVVDEIRAAGGIAEANNDDIGLPDSGENLVAQALATWGRVDAVVNNAGNMSGGGEFGSMPDATFASSMDVHFWGTLRLTQAVWPHMKERGYGRIVNTISDSLFGVQALPYVTAKGAILGFTASLTHLGRQVGIKVNGLAPAGYTNMAAAIPDAGTRKVIEDNLKSEQVAPMAAWLCHPDLDFDGQFIMSAGGRIARMTLATVPGIMTEGMDIETARDAAHQTLASTDFFAPPDCATLAGQIFKDVMGGGGEVKLM